MPEERPPGGGRRFAPPRDILAGRVRAEDLPDVARPAHAGPPAPGPAAAGLPVGAPVDAAPVSDLARSVRAAGTLPLRLTAAALEVQAQAIEDVIARGTVPAVLVPGVTVLKAQTRFLVGMIRAVAGSDPGDSRTTGGTRGR